MAHEQEGNRSVSICWVESVRSFGAFPLYVPPSQRQSNMRVERNQSEGVLKACGKRVSNSKISRGRKETIQPATTSRYETTHLEPPSRSGRHPSL